MIGYWSRLAATGNPNGSGAPTWQPFNGNSTTIQTLAPGAVGPDTTFITDHRCGFWTTLAFGGKPSTPVTG